MPASLTVLCCLSIASAFSSLQERYPAGKTRYGCQAKRLKQFSAGDIISQDPLPDGILSDRLQPSLGEVLPTSRVQEQEQREGDSVIDCIAREMSRGPHGQTLGDARYPPDLVNSNESQPGLTEQPTPDIIRCTPLKTRQTLPPAVDGFESTTVEVGGLSVGQQDDCLQPSSIDSLPRDTNLTTLHSVIRPGKATSMLVAGWNCDDGLVC